MESEEEHTGRQVETNTQSGSLKHYSFVVLCVPVLHSVSEKENADKIWSRRKGLQKLSEAK